MNDNGKRQLEPFIKKGAGISEMPPLIFRPLPPKKQRPHYNKSSTVRCNASAIAFSTSAEPVRLPFSICDK